MSQKSRLFLGVDPGMSGALAMVSQNHEVENFPMPVVGKILDIPRILCFLKNFRPRIDHAIIEQVSAMPGQGVSSMFKFGRVYGIMEGLIGGLGIPYTLVTPQAWQKVMHVGVEGKALDPKERSCVAIGRLGLDAGLPRGPRSGKLHDGVVDAVLIAEYCRRTFGEF